MANEIIFSAGMVQVGYHRVTAFDLGNNLTSNIERPTLNFEWKNTKNKR